MIKFEKICKQEFFQSVVEDEETLGERNGWSYMKEKEER